jgi:uncharacterized membrane protein
MHSRAHAPAAAVADPATFATGGGARTNAPFAHRALKAAAAAWFVVAALGQLAFLAYIVGVYGRAAWRGAPQDWNRAMPHGWVAGDVAGNLVVAGHLLFAAIVVAGGLLQLVPQVRARWPKLHRWNGRLYAGAASAAALAGVVMVWTRGTVGDLGQHLSITLNAALILACAIQAFRHARARRFDAHRRWALRLFLAAGGVWFFRLMLPLWIVANQGPAGFDPETFTGPALTAIAFLSWGLPLAVLQLYFRAQRAGPRGRLAMAGGLGVATLLTAAGIAAASMMLWLPKL